MKSPKGRTLFWTPVLLLIVSVAASAWWMPFLGTVLVHAEEPQPNCCDAIVVLAGDFHGKRIVKGGELVRAGVAPIALVSGPSNMYAQSESDLAISFAENKGFSATCFSDFPMPPPQPKTKPSFYWRKYANADTGNLLIVTSNYHTGRAGRIWRRQTAGTGIEVHIAAAPDVDLVPERWWATREGRKKIFFEWIKTLTGPLGI